MNGCVGEDYITQRLTSLTHPNYKYFLLTVNLTAINTRTMHLIVAHTVRKIPGGNITHYHRSSSILITLYLVRHCVVVCPISHALTRSLHFPC